MKETWSEVAKACGLLSLPILLPLVSVTDVGSAVSATDWQTLSPGMELKFVPIRRANTPENARITVLRIDAHLWELRAMGTSSTGENANHTARDWCEAQGLTAAINAGMFKTDGKTHVGLMPRPAHKAPHLSAGHYSRTSGAAEGVPVYAWPLCSLSVLLSISIEPLK